MQVGGAPVGRQEEEVAAGEERPVGKGDDPVAGGVEERAAHGDECQGGAHRPRQCGLPRSRGGCGPPTAVPPRASPRPESSPYRSRIRSAASRITGHPWAGSGSTSPSLRGRRGLHRACPAVTAPMTAALSLRSPRCARCRVMNQGGAPRARAGLLHDPSRRRNRSRGARCQLPRSSQPRARPSAPDKN